MPGGPLAAPDRSRSEPVRSRVRRPGRPPSRPIRAASHAKVASPPSTSDAKSNAMHDSSRIGLGTKMYETCDYHMVVIAR